MVRRSSEAGVTLVEITIVLLCIAILTAAAAPVASRTIDRAKLARAVSDEAAIKTAITNFLTDMVAVVFTNNGAAAGGTTSVLVSDGDIPTEPCPGAVPAADCTAWKGVVVTVAAPAGGAPCSTTEVIGSCVDFLERHLVTNTPAGGAYSTVAAWKGAYLSAPVEPDPWGNRYAVNTQFLKATNPATLTSNDVFVLSAGPDEQIDTVFTKNGITPGDDDIINVVRRDLNATVP